MQPQTVKLYIHAGLCNQLFMIFSLMSYCIDRGSKMLIYSFKDRTLTNNKTYWGTILSALSGDLIESFDNSIATYEEANFHYDKIPSIVGDFNAKGYFQSYKYFEHNFEMIMGQLQFREKQQEVLSKHQHLFKKKTIAMHFRMGDYLAIQNYHPIASAQYYHDALLCLEKKLENIRDNYDILYFCQKQDVEIVARYISAINVKRNYSFIKVADEIEDWEQLLLMSSCDHFVIANSTFSWYGAYMCKKDDKIVIRPSIWFGEALKHKDTKDVCPPDWIKI